MGTQALTAFRFSKRTERSTLRSRTTGNLDNGASRIGWSNLSTRAEQAMRALPLMSMAQLPQISSRQLESYVTGVVGLPSSVVGFSAISPRRLVMLRFGRYGMENFSVRPGLSGVSCR